jgi:hypothetical protein
MCGVKVILVVTACWCGHGGRYESLNTAIEVKLEPTQPAWDAKTQAWVLNQLGTVAAGTTIQVPESEQLRIARLNIWTLILVNIVMGQAGSLNSSMN